MWDLIGHEEPGFPNDKFSTLNTIVRGKLQEVGEWLSEKFFEFTRTIPAHRSHLNL